MKNYIIALIAILAWGIWAVFEKKVSIGNNVYWASVYLICIEICMLPIFLFLAVRYGGEFSFKASTVGWATASVIASSVAGLAYLWLLQRNAAAWVTAMTSAYPVVTIVLGRIFLSETISLQMWVGIAVVAVGVVILSF